MRAPRRIYVAFGEHPAAGVCVCVCSAKLVVFLLGCVFVCLFVRLFVCLCVCLVVCFFVSLFVSLVGWLFVSMCACLFFATLHHNFGPEWHFVGPFCVFFALWGTLGSHCNTWGSILTPLVYMCRFFCYLGGPWGSILASGGSVWALLGSIFVSF